VNYTVANIGTDNAGPFDVRAILDPGQSVVVDTNIGGGLAAGTDQTVTISTPPGGNCFDPDCTVSVTADSNNDVTECNENNNVLSETTPG
jgi:subtilase family serine protease